MASMSIIFELTTESRDSKKKERRSDCKSKGDRQKAGEEVAAAGTRYVSDAAIADAPGGPPGTSRADTPGPAVTTTLAGLEDCSG